MRIIPLVGSKTSVGSGVAVAPFGVLVAAGVPNGVCVAVAPPMGVLVGVWVMVGV